MRKKTECILTKKRYEEKSVVRFVQIDASHSVIRHLTLYISYSNISLKDKAITNNGIYGKEIIMKNTNNTIQNDIKLYTVKEVAEVLSISKDRVYILIRANRLPAMNIGGLKVRHDALATFLKESEGQLIDFNNPRHHYVLTA